MNSETRARELSSQLTRKKRFDIKLAKSIIILGREVVWKNALRDFYSGNNEALIDLANSLEISKEDKERFFKEYINALETVLTIHTPTGSPVTSNNESNSNNGSSTGSMSSRKRKSRKVKARKTRKSHRK
jgi:hypothetical protein